MSDIKLASALPRGEANGLGPIVPDLVDNPTGFKVVIAILDCQTITTNADTGGVVPTARIRRIEAVVGTEDLRTARRLMQRALESRSGRTMLPIGLDDEMREAFEGADFERE